LGLLGSSFDEFATEKDVIEKLELEGLSGGIARHHVFADRDRFACDLLAVRLILKALALTDQPSDVNVLVHDCGSGS